MRQIMRMKLLFLDIRTVIRFAAIFTCCLGVLIGTSDTAIADEGQFFVLALDEAGQPVLDLGQDEIRLFQGDEACRTKSIQVEANGMKIALLVDNSGPASNSLNSLRDGLQGFLEDLPPKHEVGLFTLAGYVRQRVDFTTDRQALIEDATSIFAEQNAGAVIIEGLLETWDRRFEDEDPWPVFVLVAYDGPENSRSVRERKINEFTIDTMQRGATVHTVLVTTAGGDNFNSETTRLVTLNVTRNTGGVYQSIAAATGVVGVLKQLAATMASDYELLKNRYRVGFECSGDLVGPFKVEVARPGVRVQASASRQVPR